MSDALTIEKIYKNRDEKVVNGYIRSTLLDKIEHIPKEIISLC